MVDFRVSVAVTNGTYTTGTQQTEAPKSANADIAAGVNARVGQMPEAERKLFQSIAASLDISPNSKLTKAEVKATLDLVAAAVKLILSAVPPNMTDLIARLAIEQSHNQIDDSLESRLASRQQAKFDMLDQANKLTESATQLLAGALVALVVGVVASAVSLVGSFGAMKDGGAQLKELKNASKDVSNLTKLSNALTSPNTSIAGKLETAQRTFQTITKELENIGNKGQIANVINQLGSTVGGSVNSSLGAGSKFSEAEGQRLGAMAEDEKAQVDVAKQLYDHLQELLKSIITFLHDMQEAEVQMMQAITRA